MTRDAALKALDRRPYSRGELTDLLLRKRASPEDIETVLDSLEDVGLIDDEVFAAQWVESRRRTRHLSRSALYAELRAKKIDGEIIESALSSIEPEDEYETALRFATMKVRSYAHLDRSVAYRRLLGALMRKRFSSDLCHSLARQLLHIDDEDRW